MTMNKQDFVGLDVLKTSVIYTVKNFNFMAAGAPEINRKIFYAFSQSFVNLRPFFNNFKFFYFQK